MTTIKNINNTLLFLHGLGSSGADWILQKEALSAHFQILTPDLPRHGTIAEIAAFVANLIDDSACVVGLSFGGMVAMQLALEYPEKVNKLILINTSCHMHDYFRSIAIKHLPMKIVASAIAWLAFPLKTQAHFRTRCKESISSWSKEEFYGLYKEIATFNVENRLHEIRCPTLILSGSKDKIIFPSHSATLKAGIPYAKQIVLKDAGHILPVDSSNECNQLIKEFAQ